MKSNNIKKVGFFGNMNNYPFMLALALKQKGYEIVFFVDSLEKLNRPEERYNNIVIPYPDWIIDISPCDLFLVNNPLPDDKLKLVKEKLSTCNLLFLTGFNIRFADFLNIKHICILSGSDLTNLANYTYADKLMDLYINSLIENKKLKLNSKEVRVAKNTRIFRFMQRIYKLAPLINISDKSWFMPRNFLFNATYLLSYKCWLYSQIERQRIAIKNSICFIYAPTGLIKDGDFLLNEIKVDQKKRLLGLMIDENLSKYISPIKNKKIRLFNVARFSWVTNKVNDRIDFSQLDSKGNDVMIKGISAFYHKHKTPLDIVFVKKGDDVDATIELLKIENIEHLVTWKNELSQAEVQQEYKKADIVFDQFATSFVTMGGLDAMAIGRPLIANARAEIFDNVLGEKTEICDAKTPKEVCNWLELLILNEEFRLKKGKASREFVIKHFYSENVVKRIETYLETTGEF